MLCVNNYSKEYIDQCRARIAGDVAAYESLARPGSDQSALAAFEPHFFNNLVLALDGYFTHRARAKEGKDGNPLNEVRMLCAALTGNDGVLSADKAIRYDPDRSVSRHRVGDRISLSATTFTSLSSAFFAEIESRYL